MHVGSIYVEHDRDAAWTAVVLAHMLTPAIVNNLIAGKPGNWRKAAWMALIIFVPYLLKKTGVLRLINRETLKQPSEPSNDAACLEQSVTPTLEQPKLQSKAAVGTADIESPELLER